LSFSDATSSGPVTPAAAHAVSIAPYITDIFFEPKTSMTNDGIVPKPPPKHSRM
jgi:hypothetical protein